MEHEEVVEEERKRFIKIKREARKAKRK